jgi:acetyl esterase
MVVQPVLGVLTDEAMEKANSQMQAILDVVEANPLKWAMLEWFYAFYVPEDANRTQAALSPYHADDLTGLPSATGINAQIDPLRDDGMKYANKLAAANVPVVHKIYDGVTHELFGLAGLVSESTEAFALACKSLRKALNNE